VVECVPPTSAVPLRLDSCGKPTSQFHSPRRSNIVYTCRNGVCPPMLLVLSLFSRSLCLVRRVHASLSCEPLIFIFWSDFKRVKALVLALVSCGLYYYILIHTTPVSLPFLFSLVCHRIGQSRVTSARGFRWLVPHSIPILPQPHERGPPEDRLPPPPALRPQLLYPPSHNATKRSLFETHPPTWGRLYFDGRVRYNSYHCGTVQKYLTWLSDTPAALHGQLRFT